MILDRRKVTKDYCPECLWNSDHVDGRTSCPSCEAKVKRIGGTAWEVEYHIRNMKEEKDRIKYGG